MDRPITPTVPPALDPRSGFCTETSIFHSKRAPVSLPTTPNIDIFTFVSTRVAASTSTNTALIDAATGEHLTYPQLWTSVASVASYLFDVHNIRKGDVVLILSPNSILFPVVSFAVMSLGAVLTTTNPLNTTEEISKQISDSRPSLAFTVSVLLPKIAAASTQNTFPVVLMDRTPPTHPRVVSSVFDLIKDGHQDLVKSSAVVTQNDTASLLYSSGTTGVSKGVIATHRNFITMVEVITRRFKLDSSSSSKKDVFICTVPMFHIYGLAAFATAILATGATVVVLSKFEMGDLMTAIETHKATYFPLVPPILIAMIQHAGAIKKKHNLSSLRKVLSGGAPLTKEIIQGFAKEYPAVEILQGYGLTESTGIGSSTDSKEESARYGTAGLLSPSTEARIVDPDTLASLPVNKTGELWIRGPFVMKGYFGNPEATKATLVSDGWLRTGDLCYFDEDGYLFVVDRLKELIKYKGYQVPPAELEALLLTHPEITDAAVIPFPDLVVGQYPMAYVVRKQGSMLMGDSVMEFVGKRVAPYKKIRRVAFVQDIPKNASGKILRKDLIKLATSKL